MGSRTRYAPGAFCWAELETTRLEPSRAFYGDLFGWVFEGPVAKLECDAVAGVRRGSQTRWHSYVSVDDATQVATRAAELRARAANREAIVDPQGAELRLWQDRDSIGATRVNDPGCLVWNELRTSEPAAATRFYCDLFGWSADEGHPGPGGEYTLLRMGGRLNAGIDAVPAAECSWLPYFAVDSVDRVLAAAEQAGARVLMPPVKTVIDRFTVLEDPEGARFAVVEGETDP